MSAIDLALHAARAAARSDYYFARFRLSGAVHTLRGVRRAGCDADVVAECVVDVVVWRAARRAAWHRLRLAGRRLALARVPPPRGPPPARCRMQNRIPETESAY